MRQRNLYSFRLSAVTVHIAFNPLKTGLGLLFAAVSAVLFALLQAWGMGLAFALCFVLAGFVSLDAPQKWLAFLDGLWCVGVVLMPGVLGPLMVHVLSYAHIGLWKLLLNAALCAIPFCLLLLLTGRIRLSAALSSLLLMLPATINSYVYLFRSRELSFADIFAANTAMSVLGQYSLFPTLDQLYPLLLCVLVLLLRLCFPLPKPRKTIPVRLAALVCTIALCLFAHFGSMGIPHATWNLDGSRKNGLYLNLYLSLGALSVDAPEGYSADAVAELTAALADPEAPGGTLPNIIVIMDEAFADLRVFPNDPQTNIPVTPFLDSLTENTLRGSALASVYGGNTANSEFEFLTGHSMAFLPANSVPYQQYIRQSVFSLPSYLNSLGYESIATHAYHATGWARSTIYPLLGFSDSTFLDAYPQDDLLRGYVTDDEQLRFMLELLDSHGSEAPVFLFGVTIQNHGGYTYSGPDAPSSITLTDAPGRYPQAEQYLSLLHETDNALRHFLTALSDYPEDTIVLLFGDHFPLLEDAFYEELCGSPLDTLQEEALLYRVPYLIWANFDLRADTPTDTSLNYLSGHLLDAAGLPRSEYQQFLAFVEQTVPAFSALGCFSPTQGGYIRLSDAAGAEAEALSACRILQYNALFDEGRQDPIFSPQP